MFSALNVEDMNKKSSPGLDMEVSWSKSTSCGSNFYSSELSNRGLTLGQEGTNVFWCCILCSDPWVLKCHLKTYGK